ncbi:arginase-1-like [Paramacrobiotus metropolitanus]|uniref:arginase-1-like n=1 Tax=Paramacrobiotus metropolitanus TaxID=2943436 RepID=UPI002445DC9F|nr:arginase-1-like [Paramacrobiotus metropolitanus]
MAAGLRTIFHISKRGIHGLRSEYTNPKFAGIFGALMNRGQGKEGVRDGPNAIREAGLFQQLSDCGITAKDYGDVAIEAVASDDPWKKVKYCRTVGNGCKMIAGKMDMIIKDQGVPVMLGGDHATAIGSILGHAQAIRDVRKQHVGTTSPICVLWVDAHADINTPLTTYTGNLHGCPVSFLLHETMNCIPHGMPGMEWVRPCLTADRIAYIGLRALDPDEYYLLEKLNVTYFHMRDVDKLGVQQCVERALHAINPRGDLPLHLSYDIDALDPNEAASTGTPVMGGLTLREGLQIVEHVHQSGQLSAMDLVEVNPELGTPYQRAKTMEAAIAIISGALGKPRQGVPPKPGFVLPIPEALAKDS